MGPRLWATAKAGPPLAGMDGRTPHR